MATFQLGQGWSATFKVVTIGIVSVALVVPLLLIAGLTFERQSRQTEVETELGSIWGQRQTVGGVALVVPFTQPVVGRADQFVNGRLAILPKTLSVDGSLAPEVRRRGIFNVTLYRATLTVAGQFDVFDATKAGLANATFSWDRAVLHASVSDLRGVQSSSALTWAATTVEMEAAGDDSPFGTGLRAPVAASATDPTSFRLELVVGGSSAVRVTPTGATTDVRLRSTWPHPSFAGAALPTDQTVSAEGFTAAWRTTSLTRPYPQMWVIGPAGESSMLSRLHNSGFGVDLVTTVDHYQQVTRALKYGFLFIVMTFGVFLAWEVMAGLRLHPIQYLFVGLALVVFFLLLLSLSEHIPFARAYLIAAVSTVGLVAGYATSILAAGRAGVAIGGWLTALYGLLFVLLQLEDLALLVGSVVVFLLLLALMYLTRGVDWYSLGRKSDVTR